MKKILALAAILVFVACNISFAAALGASGTPGVTPSAGLQIFGGVNAADAAGGTSVLLGKMSKGVNFAANYTTTGYALATKHTSGTKNYGTAHDSTAIFFKDSGSAVLAVGDVTAAGNTAFGAAWTAM